MTIIHLIFKDSWYTLQINPVQKFLSDNFLRKYSLHWIAKNIWEPKVKVIIPTYKKKLQMYWVNTMFHGFKLI